MLMCSGNTELKCNCAVVYRVEVYRCSGEIELKCICVLVI